MGGLYPGGRKVLGGKSCFGKEQVVQPLGYPVHHEEGHGRTVKVKISYAVVPGERSVLSGQSFSDEDIVTVGIDATGISLHKRGYRPAAGKAPIAENLAAALILLTPWKKDRILVDPFCGSGTFPIEAAMMAANIAPGMNRSFIAETWANLVEKRAWYEAVNESHDMIRDEIETDIQGYDADPEVLRTARRNAEDAGVAHLIHFQQREVKDLSHPKKYGFIITNPPYGERLEEKSALPQLYREFGEAFRRLDSWSAYMITSYEDAERYFGRKADRNRKIYNGMLRTYFYQFQGPKPPKKKR